MSRITYKFTHEDDGNSVCDSKIIAQYDIGKGVSLRLSASTGTLQTGNAERHITVYPLVMNFPSNDAAKKYLEATGYNGDILHETMVMPGVLMGVPDVFTTQVNELAESLKPMGMTLPSAKIFEAIYDHMSAQTIPLFKKVRDARTTGVRSNER